MMHRYANPSILFLLVMLGCVPQIRKPSTYEEVNHEAKRGVKAQLSLLDGQTFITKNIHVEEDSVRWNDPETDEIHSVPILTVSDIVFLKRHQAAKEGFVYGALLGAISGLVIGYAQGDDSDPNCTFCLTKEKTAMGFGFLGIPIGAIVGSFVNSTPDVKYIMNQRSEESAQGAESLNVEKLSGRMEKEVEKDGSTALTLGIMLSAAGLVAILVF